MHPNDYQNPLARVKPSPNGYDARWFEAVFTAIDRLHDALCDESLGHVSPLGPEQMVGWLEDIVYTAREAISEIRAKQPDTASIPDANAG